MWKCKVTHKSNEQIQKEEIEAQTLSDLIDILGQAEYLNEDTLELFMYRG